MYGKKCLHVNEENESSSQGLNLSLLITSQIRLPLTNNQIIGNEDTIKFHSTLPDLHLSVHPLIRGLVSLGLCAGQLTGYSTWWT